MASSQKMDQEYSTSPRPCAGQ